MSTRHPRTLSGKSLVEPKKRVKKCVDAFIHQGTWESKGGGFARLLTTVRNSSQYGRLSSAMLSAVPLKSRSV